MKKYYGVKTHGELEWLMKYFEAKDDSIMWIGNVESPTGGMEDITLYDADDGGGLAICLDDDNELQYARWDWYKNNWDAKDLTEVSDMIKQNKENMEKLIKSYYVKDDEEYDWLMKHLEAEYPGLTWKAGGLPTQQESFGSPIIAIEKDGNQTRIVHVPDLVTYFDDAYEEDGYAPMPISVESLMDGTLGDNDEDDDDVNEDTTDDETTKYIKLDLQDLYGTLDYNDVSGMMNSIYEVAEMGSFLWDYCFSGKYPSELERFKHQVEVAQVAYDMMIEEKNTKYKVKVPGTANSYYYQSLSGNLQATDREYEQHNFYFTQADLKHYGLDKDTFKKEKVEQCLAG